MSCCISGCERRAIIKCSCTIPNVYICKRHNLRHVQTPGVHQMKSISEDSPDQNILSFVKSIFSYTEPKRNNILRCTKYLFETISTASAKAISTLDRIELMATRLCKMAYSRDTICSDTYSKLKQFSFSQTDKGCSVPVKLIGTIESIFDLDFLNRQDDNKVVFSSGSTQGQLPAIDLTSFKLSLLLSFPQIGSWGQACAVDKDNLFLN